MDCCNTLPLNISRAYAMTAARKPAGAQAPIPTPAPSSPRDAATIAAAKNLVASRVEAPVAFDGGASPTADPSLQLYTRAADRIEAATGVAIGRSLDVRG